jgi:hypothetical protein
VAVTISVPSGALEATQVPAPPESLAVHSGVESMLKTTVPVGVPEPEVGATVVE